MSMRDASKVSLKFICALAVVALLASAAQAQTLQWLNSPVVVPSRITSSPNDNALTTLKGNVYPLARAEYDQGRVSDSLPMEHIIMMLQRSPDQEKMLSAVIDGLHNRRSPLYHHWLKPAQYGQHFGPSDQDLSVVTTWLKGQGFKIDQVPPGRTSIIFSGTAGQVRSAFHTEVHNLDVKGERHIGIMSEPRIPTALTPVVSGFRSLHNFFAKPMMVNAGLAKRDPKTHKWTKVAGPTTLREAAKVHAGITDTTDGLFLVGPQDFYTIYNENPLLSASTPINGTGATIAVLEETDINPADVTTFQSQFNIAATGTVNYLFGADGVFCTDPGILTDGEESEADLDAQWANAVAPGATLNFVSCASTATTQGIDLSAMYVINNLSATVSAMSLSYGGCEWLGQLPSVQFFTQMWQQAAAEGQTVSVASGDGGAMLCDTDSEGAVNPPSVSFISDTPYNISAGGTDFADGYISDYLATGTGNIWWNTTETTQANGYESALSYIPEVSWGGECSSPITASFFQANAVASFGTTYTPEAICNYDYLNVGAGLETVIGGTGGVSAFTGIPTWQSAYGVGLAGNNTSTLTRNQPDVSLFASAGWLSHALVFCESDIAGCDYSMDGTYPIAGGTSFVAPQLAGFMALVVQQTGSFQGVANYNLYNLATTEYGTPTGTFSGAGCSGSGLGAGVGSTCMFNDVANDTPCLAGGTAACNSDGVTLTSDNAQSCIFADYANFPGTIPTCFTITSGDTLGQSTALGPDYSSTYADAYPTGQGYDAATGLGSMNFANMVTNWNSASTLFPTTTTLAADNTFLLTTGSTDLTATVTATGRGGFVPPLGSVTFTDTTTSTALGTAMLSPTCNSATPPVCTGPSTATLTVEGTALAVGTDSITASFGGDAANDAASTSAPVNVEVALVPSTTTLAVSATTATAGTSLTFTATVTGSGGTPTGTVTFVDGTTTLGTATLSGGTASFSTSSLAVGGHAIAAQYSGDTTFAASMSGATAVTINAVALVASNTALTASATTAAPGTLLTFTATVTGAGGTPTGTVTFVDGTTTLGTATLSGGIASFSTSSLAIGGHAIVAQYSGDSTFAASTSAATAVTIATSATTAIPLVVSSSASVLSITGGSTGMATLTVDTSPSGQSVGTITLACSVVPAGPTCSLSSTSVSSPGPATVTATIATTASNASLHRRNAGWMLAMILPGLLLLPTTSRSARRRIIWLLGGCLLVLAISFAGCGGSSKTTTITGESAPYNVTVTASATGATSASASIAVDVSTN
jgi:hypothetical protein